VVVEGGMQVVQPFQPRVPSSSAVVFYPSMPPEQQQPLLDMKVEAKK